jgi:diaminopimelate epimerase
MRFYKYQALGNDYLVLDGVSVEDLTAPLIARICDRHFGLGSDGILLPSLKNRQDVFELRIFNPDGSEAEKSGNGIRIFARYLWDCGLVRRKAFTVQTVGGAVRCEVRGHGKDIFVEMGRATFDSQAVPIRGHRREVVREAVQVGGHTLRFTGVSVGNPHCVVHADEISRGLAESLGPLLEHHELFPNRTNVQFVKVIDPHRIQIEIWERGAGYTLASGTSSCAAAAASVRLGLCQGNIAVAMPGGVLEIGVGPNFELTMIGPAKRIADGELSRELLEDAR